MPKARVEEEHERGNAPPLVRGVSGTSPEKNLNSEHFYERL